MDKKLGFWRPLFFNLFLDLRFRFGIPFQLDEAIQVVAEIAVAFREFINIEKQGDCFLVIFGIVVADGKARFRLDLRHLSLPPGTSKPQKKQHCYKIDILHFYTLKKIAKITHLIEETTQK